MVKHDDQIRLIRGISVSARAGDTRTDKCPLPVSSVVPVTPLSYANSEQELTALQEANSGTIGASDKIGCASSTLVKDELSAADQIYSCAAIHGIAAPEAKPVLAATARRDSGSQAPGEPHIALKAAEYQIFQVLAADQSKQLSELQQQREDAATLLAAELNKQRMAVAAAKAELVATQQAIEAALVAQQEAEQHAAAADELAAAAEERAATVTALAAKAATVAKQHAEQQIANQKQRIKKALDDMDEEASCRRNIALHSADQAEEQYRERARTAKAAAQVEIDAAKAAAKDKVSTIKAELQAALNTAKAAAAAQLAQIAAQTQASVAAAKAAADQEIANITAHAAAAKDALLMSVKLAEHNACKDTISQVDAAKDLAVKEVTALTQIAQHAAEKKRAMLDASKQAEARAAQAIATAAAQQKQAAADAAAAVAAATLERKQAAAEAAAALAAAEVRKQQAALEAAEAIADCTVKVETAQCQLAESLKSLDRVQLSKGSIICGLETVLSSMQSKLGDNGHFRDCDHWSLAQMREQGAEALQQLMALLQVELSMLEKVGQWEQTCPQVAYVDCPQFICSC